MDRPRFLRGAIVYFTEALVSPVSNIVVFQYNPDGITRTLTTHELKQQQRAAAPEELLPTYAEPFDPEEQIDIGLVLDATDALERDSKQARAAGIADRIAALESLAFPIYDATATNLAAPVQQTLTPPGLTPPIEDLPAVRKPKLPVALFVWGPGRIVPVRVKTVRVEEQQWNQALYPTRARVTLGMVVMAPEVLELELGETSGETRGVKLARACYKLTAEQRKALAAMNLYATADATGTFGPLLGRFLPL